MTIGSLWTSLHSNISNLYKPPHSSQLTPIYVLIYLESLCTFSFGLCFTLFLSTDFGLDDILAGILFGCWDALSTIGTLFTGFLMDKIGVGKSLRVGFFITLVARIIIFVTTHTGILCIAIIILSLGSCLCSPVLTICIKKATTEDEECRRFAFGLYYVIMNIAALCSGPLVDICSRMVLRSTVQDKQQQTSSDWNLSSYRLVLLCSIISNIMGLCITQYINFEKTTSPSHTLIQMTEDEIINDLNHSSEEDDDDTSASPSESFTWMNLYETIQSKAFLRFITLCIITINIQTMFQHFDATLPKYLIRRFGEQVSYGSIFSINPAIIILLVPFISAWTSHIHPLLLIHHGSYVSAISVFFMVLWMSIPSSIVFMLVWSIGEAIWSPRLVDYLVSMSTEGKEGTFMALSSVPLFVAKLPVGWLSGYLLESYCPENSHDDNCHGTWIWLIISLFTMTSPILLTIFWRYLSQQNVSKEDLPDSCTRIELESLQST